MIWASRWSVTLRTFYRQILSVLYSSFPFGNFRPRLVRAILVYINSLSQYIFFPRVLAPSNQWFSLVAINRIWMGFATQLTHPYQLVTAGFRFKQHIVEAFWKTIFLGFSLGKGFLQWSLPIGSMGLVYLPKVG